MYKLFLAGKQFVSATAAAAQATAANAAALAAQATANAAQATANAATTLANTANATATAAQAAANAALALANTLATYWSKASNTLTTTSFVTQASGWRDNIQPFTNGRAAGGALPTWGTFLGGISVWKFPSNSIKELWLNFHIDHDYKPNSLIFPHIHWAPTTTGAGTVRWGIEYTAAKGHGQQTFPVTQTIYLEQAASGIANRHQITETSVGIDFGIEVDAVIMVRVFRDATHVNDTYAGDAVGLFCDLHYESDRLNTPQKSPNFYAGG